MATIAEIDASTREFSDAKADLICAVEELREQQAALARRHVNLIRRCAAKLKDKQAALRALVDGNPQLFVRPRTVTLYGVKVGYQKAKGSVVFADGEAKTIERIHKLLPTEQAELLIRKEESVHKQSVYDLAAGDLKRLGIEIVGAGDVVVIKDATEEVDKFVAALLKDAPEVAE